MLRKLQNLLFEDEEVIEEQDTDDIEEEVKPKPKRQAHKVHREEAEEQPVLAEKSERAEMQRIDVTQPILVQPTVKKSPVSESVFKEPSIQRAEPRPIVKEPISSEPVIGDRSHSEPAQEIKKPSLGINIDEVAGAVKTEKHVSTPAAKSAPRKEPVSASDYEFRPVISPIFGIDEKDMSAVQTTSKISENRSKKEGTESNVKPVISPIYGANKESAPSAIQNTVEKSNEMAKMIPDAGTAAAEEDVPAFSLDDILKVRDEEFAQETKDNKQTDTSLDALFNDMDENSDDSTVVINNRNLSLFDGTDGDNDKK